MTTICCECNLWPSILRGMCAGCNAQTDADERLRDLYAAEPWEFNDDDRDAEGNEL